MRKLLFFLFVGITISLTSCRKDFAFEPSIGGLEFSKDTVYLDTVFTNIGSSTYRLKVYNRSDKDISIPSVQLGKGLNSKYRIMVDGMSGNGKIFKNVELLAKDSMFVFIEVTSDVASANPTDFLYTDQIQFTNVNGASQNVELVTLIQDAYFIYPNRPLSTGIKETLGVEGLEGIEGHTLTTPAELNWTSAKPYVVYGYATVPNGETLTINNGTSVHFHANSGLVVDNQAKLIIDGNLNATDTNGNITTKHEVTFEGDRLEPSFEDVPGQWGTILLFSSLDNQIKHLTLKNATVGLFMQTNTLTGNPPKVTINDSQFYGCSNIGILGRNSNIIGNNVVSNSAGQYSFLGSIGGKYNFTHCTFNNNWNSSKQYAVLLDNYYAENNIVLDTYDLTANFINCIIYGSNNVELLLDKKETSKIYNVNFNNCLVKYSSSSTVPSFLADSNAFGNIRNQDPKFKNVNKNQLQPQTITSGAYQKGTSSSIPNDILGNSRISPPDLGAYNVKP